MKGQTRIRISLLLVVIGLVATAAQPAYAAQPLTTPSLTGEQFAGTLKWKADCNADGTGRITFVGTGAATGPYPGTFREWGAVWVTKSAGTLYENFIAAFEIRVTAPAARVGGTKMEKPPQTFDGLNCQGYPQFGYGSFPDNPYRAFISRGGHNFRDEGTSFSEVDFGCALTGCHPNQMFENFTSTKGATLTADPDDFQGEQ